MQLEQTVGHHREIGHHVVLAQKAAQGFHHFRHVGVRLMEEFVKFTLGLLVPMPGVLEGFNLRLAVVAARRFEEQIVVALGIERRVEIDEVNGFVRNVLAEDLEIVAVIELVHWRGSVRGKMGGVNFRLCDGSGVAVRKDRLTRLGEWQRRFGRTKQSRHQVFWPDVIFAVWPEVLAPSETT